MPSRFSRYVASPRRPEVLLYVGSGVAVLAIIAIVAYLLLRERDSVEESATRTARNLVQLIESDILRNVEFYDQSLKNLVWAAAQPVLPQLSADVRQRLLFNKGWVDQRQGDVLWLNAAGRIVGDSVQMPPRDADFADTPELLAHRQRADLGLLISPPFKARLGDLDWCISFSRRINDDKGQFAGIAAGALRLSYFSGLFQRLEIGAQSSINLFNTDGQLLARQPAVVGSPHDYSQRPNFQRMLRLGSGSFTALSGQGGGERLYTFSRVGHLPLLVTVVNSTDEVFQSWRRSVALVSVATALLCLGMSWLTVLLGRELRRRHAAERGLAALAATDSLTGLANRRSLDNRLRHEWARAQRSRQPLAVLMVDVDHFKAFNQRHGHAGGDLALQAVARAIESCIRRPADLAARYGGEEFQVVLPETDQAGAELLAERIRLAVQAITPYGMDLEPITVSIGTGVALPGMYAELPAMLAAADAALYRAKALGRNRVESAAA